MFLTQNVCMFFNVQRLHTLTRKVDMFLICKDITKKRNAEKSASLPPILSAFSSTFSSTFINEIKLVYSEGIRMKFCNFVG